MNTPTVRSSLLSDIFGLPDNASALEIIAAPIKLPKLKPKPILEKRLASIKKKYETIPKEHLWYYPEGEEYVGNSDAKRTKCVGFDIPIPKKKTGRPKADLKTESKTPSILNFFKAFPVIPKPSSINNRSISSNQPSGSSNKAEEQTRKSGMVAVRIDAKKDEIYTDFEDEDDEDLM